MKTRGDFAADPRLIYISAIAAFIGAVCTLVALVLLKMIALFTNIFYYHQFTFSPRLPTNLTWGVASIFVPAVGGLIIGLMARYGSEKIRGHGIPEALEAILFGKSLMKPKVAILKPISSAISIGSGGPFGAEGPIIMTGGAFGSIFAQAFHLSSIERKTLLVAGAAAGMTAVFGTPIAAILLAVELLLFEWRPRSLVPVAVASIVAAAIRPFLFGSGPLFPIPPHDALSASGIAISAGVGLIAGIFATLVSKTLYTLEDAFHKLPFHWMWWPALGGIVVGIGGYFEPRALGVGYDVIGSLLKGEFTPFSVLGLISIKALIWVIALASGTSGGVLAPLLMMGASLGVVESSFIHSGGPIWALVSMAAVLGGMMRSPFMAVIFAFELTHDVESLLPLMTASIIAYATTVLVMKRSILTEKVVRRGYDLFREYSVDPLERMRASEVMTPSPVAIPAGMPLGEAIQKYFSSGKSHHGYPVVEDSGKLVGVLVASDILHHSSSELKLVEHAMSRSIKHGYPQESCRVLAERMVAHGIGRMPIVDRADSMKIVGMVTRSDLMKCRVSEVEDQKRERFFLGIR